MPDVASNAIEAVFHGVGVRFTFDTADGRDRCLARIPQEWLRRGEPELTIHWREADRVWADRSLEFDDDPDPYFEVRDQVVLQRDLCARRVGPSEAIVVSRSESADGFFNTLRWFLPPALLRHGVVVAHSCAVVGKDNRAMLFLGHSGAGKSTVATFAQDRGVLGDDINLVRIGRGQATVEPALLGQARFDRSRLDQKYPVKAFYWLRQAGRVAIRPFGQAEAARVLLHSFLLPDPSLANALVGAAGRVASMVTGAELSFRKDADFWEEIDG